jgi:hypothetical protein
VNANWIVLGVALCVILFIGLAVAASIGGIFYLILRTNLQRSRAVFDEAVQSWSQASGYRLISAEKADGNSPHPFRDRFGFGVRKHGDYGGVVHRILIEANGRQASGWLFIPLKGQGGIQIGSGATTVLADWRNAEVAWDGTTT